jgi:hypothetical protein
VSNQTGCIKVANDFVDIHSIEASTLVSAFFRNNRLQDILQLPWILWHAWQSLSQLPGLAAMESPCTGNKKRWKMTKLKKIERRQRETLSDTEKTETAIYSCPDTSCQSEPIRRDRRFTFRGIVQHM